MAGKTNMMMKPVISKMYSSPSQVVMGIRKRPHVASGGGFVATDTGTKKLAFRVDGCGVLGNKDELILSEADGGTRLLKICRKGWCLVEALCTRKWKAYSYDYQGCQKLVFTLKEPNSFLLLPAAKNNGSTSKSSSSSSIKISIDNDKSREEFEIKGYFPGRECSIVDSNGNIIAQVGVAKEVEKVMESNDLYHVVIKPGIDQAFVLGIIAILDHIYDESTIC